MIFSILFWSHSDKNTHKLTDTLPVLMDKKKKKLQVKSNARTTIGDRI